MLVEQSEPTDLTCIVCTGSVIGNSRLRLDQSMTLLEQHLVDEQLQQDWADPDPATAFFLALTWQMESKSMLTASTSPSADFSDFSQQADSLAEKVVAHLSAHPELCSSPVTSSASAAAAAATAGGSSNWRKAVEDDSGGFMVGDGMISAVSITSKLIGLKSEYQTGQAHCALHRKRALHHQLHQNLATNTFIVHTYVHALACVRAHILIEVTNTKLTAGGASVGG